MGWISLKSLQIFWAWSGVDISFLDSLKKLGLTSSFCENICAYTPLCQIASIETQFHYCLWQVLRLWEKIIISKLLTNAILLIVISSPLNMGFRVWKKMVAKSTWQDVLGTTSFSLYHIHILRYYNKYKFNN